MAATQHTGVIRKTSAAPHEKLLKLIKAAGAATATGTLLESQEAVCSTCRRLPASSTREVDVDTQLSRFRRLVSFFRNNRRARITVASVFDCVRSPESRTCRAGPFSYCFCYLLLAWPTGFTLLIDSRTAFDRTVGAKKKKIYL